MPSRPRSVPRPAAARRPSWRQVGWRLAYLVVPLALCGLAAAARVAYRPLPQWATGGSLAAFGALHVHTAQSHDSRSRTVDVARAAAQLGLRFVVLTDHNSRQRLLPPRLCGVEVLSFAELSTPCGHVIAFDDPQPITAALRHSHRVLHRLHGRGTMALLAHPSDLQRPWEATGPCHDAGPADGVEVANTAAALRRLGIGRLLAALPFLAVAPRWALAQLYDRDTAALDLWDAQPRVDFVGVCGLDAHGWLDHRLELLPWQLGIPAASRSVARSIRQGEVFCSAGSLGKPADFTFVAQLADGRQLGVGQTVAANRVVSFEARLPPLQGAPQWLVLLRNGQPVQRSDGGQLTFANPPAGTYRVEGWTSLPGLFWGTRDVPVLYSNRIALQAAAARR